MLPAPADPGTHALWVATNTLAVCASALFGVVGFDRPSWVRGCTTAARFRLAQGAHAALYVILLLLAYAALCRLLWSDTSEPLEWVAYMWLALAFVAAVRLMPFVARPLRRALHRVGGAPGVGRELAKYLAETTLDPCPEDLEEARALLLHRSIDAERNWLPLARPLHRQLLATAALFVRLRAWEGDGRHDRFLEDTRPEFDHLRQRFDGLLLSTSRALVSIERLGTLRHLYGEGTRAGSDPDEADAARDENADAFDDQLRRLVTDLVADACEDIGQFHRDACALSARAVLSSYATARGRNAAVKCLGAGPAPREAPNAYAALLNSAVILFIGLWLFFVLLPMQERASEEVQRIVTITMKLLGSIAIAVIPKLHYGFANAGLHPRTPPAFVVGAAVAALAWAVLVNMVVGLLLNGGWAGAQLRLSQGVPYLWLPPTTAAIMAWLVQDHRWLSVPVRTMRRLLDAATLASAWTLGTLVVAITSAAMGNGWDIPALAAGAVGSVLLGGLVGFAVPGSVRDERTRELAQRPMPFVAPLGLARAATANATAAAAAT